jgi:demethylmenaquinone methyltransferase/2-methoxy-6-polyprenyl-1,4-benzoquinol methylase
MLDVATGTAEVAMLAATMLEPQHILGIDISEGMLEIGKSKVDKAGLSEVIQLQKGDSEDIDAPDDSFDAVTVAFGVRNFADLTRGLSEIRRVLRPGGRLVVLEFSKPRLPGVRSLYGWYMERVAPGMGGLFTRNPAAYRYLNDSVRNFPEGSAFLDVLQTVGFRETSCKRLSLGICSVYSASK